MPHWPLLVIFFLGGLWALVFVSRKWTGDRVLASIVGFSYLFRAALAIALYAVSFWSPPIAAGLQRNESYEYPRYGFWVFAPDALYFHDYGKAAAVALAADLEAPFVVGNPDYPLVVATIYRVFGPHQLFPILLNIFLASVTVLLAYSLARSLWPIHGSRTVAALVAFWPSSILWSTQLLKDSLEVFLVVAFLWAFHRLHPDVESTGSPPRRLRKLALLAFAFVGLVAAYRLRDYVALILLASTLAVLIASAVVAIWRKRPWRAVACCGLAVWFACAVWTSTWIVPESVGKPANPEATFARLAEHMVSIGELEGAAWQLQMVAARKEGAVGDRAERDRLVARELDRLQAEQSARGELAARGSDQPVVVEQPPGSEVAPDERFRLPDLSGDISRLRRFLSLSWLADLDQDIASLRGGYFGYGGSLVGNRDVPHDFLGFVRSAPQAWATALLTPNPLTHFSNPAATGVFRDLAMIEVLLVAALLYFSGHGLVAALRRAWPVGLLIVLFSLILGTSLGYAVPNVGALFRLRLAIIIPLCVLAGGGGLHDSFTRVVRWARRHVVVQ